MGRTHGNGMGATPAGGVMSRGVASEFDRSMNKASYVDDTPVPVIVMDCEHNIEYVNSAAALLAGKAAEACVGLKLWDLFDNEAIRNGTGWRGRIREGRTISGDAECIVQGRTMAIRAFAVSALRREPQSHRRGAGDRGQLGGSALRRGSFQAPKDYLEGQLRERAKSEEFQGHYRDQFD